MSKRIIIFFQTLASSADDVGDDFSFLQELLDRVLGDHILDSLQSSLHRLLHSQEACWNSQTFLSLCLGTQWFKSISFFMFSNSIYAHKRIFKEDMNPCSVSYWTRQNTEELALRWWFGNSIAEAPSWQHFWTSSYGFRSGIASSIAKALLASPDNTSLSF